MTRLASTCWAGAALGLAFTTTALAQSPDTTPSTDDTTTTTDTDTTTTTTTTDTDTTTTADPVEPVDDPVIEDDPAMGRTVPPPADIDVDVVAPPPPPQQPATDYVVSPTTNVYVEDNDDEWRPLSGIGMAVAAGGGVGAFTDDSARNATEPGGDWDVRLTVGTRSPIAFEGSYIGSAQSIDALGLDSDAVLLGNGVQGALRVNTTIDLPIQPFLFAGIGWRHYQLTNSDTNLSDIADDDDVLEVPLGAGIAGRWQGLMLDARGEYRAAAYDEMLPSRNDDGDAAMHRWGVKATAGFEF